MGWRETRLGLVWGIASRFCLRGTPHKATSTKAKGIEELRRIRHCNAIEGSIGNTRIK